MAEKLVVVGCKINLKRRAALDRAARARKINRSQLLDRIITEFMTYGERQWPTAVIPTQTETDSPNA